MQICQWYRVCDAGALRAEPLGHPLYLARSTEVMEAVRESATAPPPAAAGSGESAATICDEAAATSRLTPRALS